MSIPRIESSVVTEFDPVCSCTRPMWVGWLYSTLMAEVWMRLCSMYVLYGSYDNHIVGSRHNSLLGHTHLSESMSQVLLSACGYLSRLLLHQLILTAIPIARLPVGVSLATHSR